MKASTYAFLILSFFFCISGFEKQAEAGSDFFLGFSYHHPTNHYYRSYYYRPYAYWNWYGAPYWYPYYRPYYYRPYGSGYYYGYGEIRLEIKPKTAKVYVDGDYVGILDDFDSWHQRLDIEPGKHRIVVRESGFAPYVETIRVLPGRNYHIKQQMQPGQDAIAERDLRLGRGEEREYDKRNQERDRRFESDPYRDQGREESAPPEGEFPPAGANTRTFALQVHPADATVYIDGNYYGTADVDESGELQVLLPKGMHKIEIVRPGYESFSKEIQVDENSNEKIVVNLQKK